MRTIVTISALTACAALMAACSNNETKSDAASGDAAPAAQSAELPAPAAGLWEQTMTGGPMPQAVTVKMCMGEPTPGVNPFENAAAGTSCSKQEFKRVAGGAEFSSVCESQGMTVTSEGKVTGDMNTAYKVEISTKTTGAALPPGMPADMKMEINAKRLGDCPAGAAPGSVVQ